MSFEKLDLSNRKRSGGRNVVLLYGYPNSCEEILTTITQDAKIDEWIYIDEHRKMLKVKEIINNIKNNEQVTFNEADDKIVLFHGTSQYELQQFITKIRSAFEGNPYIAMVTKTSKEWVFADLIQELKEERKSLTT